MNNEKGEGIETRQERRERKLLKKKERMQMHGKGIIRVYKDAILKRFKGGKTD